MHRPHTNPQRRATPPAALTALIALSACGSDDPAASESSIPRDRRRLGPTRRDGGLRHGE